MVPPLWNYEVVSGPWSVSLNQDTSLPSTTLHELVARGKVTPRHVAWSSAPTRGLGIDQVDAIEAEQQQLLDVLSSAHPSLSLSHHFVRR